MGRPAPQERAVLHRLKEALDGKGRGRIPLWEWECAISSLHFVPRPYVAVGCVNLATTGSHQAGLRRVVVWGAITGRPHLSP